MLYSESLIAAWEENQGEHFVLRNATLHRLEKMMVYLREQNGLNDEVTISINPKPACGSSNLAFSITFSDGVHWIMLVPKIGYDPEWTDERANHLEHVASTMMILNKNPTVMVPAVRGYHNTTDNCLGFPFIVQDCVHGNTLQFVWTEFDNNLSRREARRKKVQSLIDIERALHELSKIKADSIGFPVFDRHGNIQRVEPMWTNYDKTVGPYQTTHDYMKERFLQLNPPKTAFETSMMNVFLDLAIYADTSDGFSLHHPDLNANNILLTADGRLAGIIDWDNTCLMPRIAGQDSYPRFLDEDWITSSPFSRDISYGSAGCDCIESALPDNCKFSPSDTWIQNIDHAENNFLRRAWRACTQHHREISCSSESSVEKIYMLMFESDCFDRSGDDEATFSAQFLKTVAEGIATWDFRHAVNHIICKIIKLDRSEASRDINKQPALPYLPHLKKQFEQRRISPDAYKRFISWFAYLLYHPTTTSLNLDNFRISPESEDGFEGAGSVDCENAWNEWANTLGLGRDMRMPGFYEVQPTNNVKTWVNDQYVTEYQHDDDHGSRSKSATNYADAWLDVDESTQELSVLYKFETPPTSYCKDISTQEINGIVTDALHEVLKSEATITDSVEFQFLQLSTYTFADEFVPENQLRNIIVNHDIRFVQYLRKHRKKANFVLGRSDFPCYETCVFDEQPIDKGVRYLRADEEQQRHDHSISHQTDGMYDSLPQLDPSTVPLEPLVPTVSPQLQQPNEKPTDVAAQTKYHIPPTLIPNQVLLRKRTPGAKGTLVHNKAKDTRQPTHGCNEYNIPPTLIPNQVLLRRRATPAKTNAVASQHQHTNVEHCGQFTQLPEQVGYTNLNKQSYGSYGSTEAIEFAKKFLKETLGMK